MEVTEYRCDGCHGKAKYVIFHPGLPAKPSSLSCSTCFPSYEREVEYEQISSLLSLPDDFSGFVPWQSVGKEYLKYREMTDRKRLSRWR
jgi:hypothetical protein